MFSQYVGKTVLVTNLKLNNYKESLSFNSQFKTEITQVETHQFKTLEGKFKISDLEMISSVAPKEVGDKERLPKTLRDLES
jgi:hypothetical protein